MLDTLRRQIGSKDEELRHFNKQFEYQEVEKIKIVQKLAQVEQDFDLKSHELRKIKSQLGDKEDTLEVSIEKEGALIYFLALFAQKALIIGPENFLPLRKGLKEKSFLGDLRTSK